MKKLLSFFLLVSLPIVSFFNLSIVSAETNDFEIIPEAEKSVLQDVKDIGSEGGKVRDTYNEKVKDMTLAEQLASGVMDRDTILDYAVYLARFLSQIGLLIGAIMIIYAGYIYGSSVFTGGDASGGKKAITRAIIGVVVIAFSYAIMKILTSAFIS